MYWFSPELVIEFIFLIVVFYCFIAERLRSREYSNKVTRPLLNIKYAKMHPTIESRKYSEIDVFGAKLSFHLFFRVNVSLFNQVYNIFLYLRRANIKTPKSLNI